MSREDPKRCSGSAVNQHVTIEYDVMVKDCPLCLALGALDEAVSTMEAIAVASPVRYAEDISKAIGSGRYVMRRLHWLS